MNRTFDNLCRICLKEIEIILYSCSKGDNMFHMDLEYNKGILFARLRGDLSRKGSYRLNNYLVPVILKHKIKYLVYNFFAVTSIDESGMDAVLNTKCAIRANKGKIFLCEVPKEFTKEIRRLRIKETSSELTALELIQV